MIALFYTHFEIPLPPDKWQTYLSQLPENLQQKINRFRRWQDQHASLFGKLLLLKALSKAGYPTDCLNRLQYEPKYKRPFIDNTGDFNISHSGEYVVCAFSHQGRIGIDIERIRTTLKVSNFQDYMTPKQWTDITTPQISSEKFFDYWTIKESVIKVDGRGLSIPLQDIHTDGHKATLHDAVWFLTKLEIDPNYVCHLATNWENPAIDLIKLDFF
ncbi:MAG: hypothetical protein DRR19_00120 [Candidatus Parabeggiatoa sp. nov. 1]|nr:MAG: hypothetical protein DRR19_00120 [Gammaproteobacteria bacterium]